MVLKEQILENWNGKESIRTITKKLDSSDENTIRVIFNRLVASGEIEETSGRDKENFKLYVRVVDTISDKLSKLMRLVENFVVREAISTPCYFTLNILVGKKFETSSKIQNMPQEIKTNFELLASMPPASGINLDDGTSINPGRITINVYQDEIAGWSYSGLATGVSFKRKPSYFDAVFVHLPRESPKKDLLNKDKK